MLNHTRIIALFCVLASVANAYAAAPNPVGPGAPILRIINTRHYEIRTDLEPAFANEMAQRMDSMYDQYVRQMSEFNPAKNAKPLLVYLFTKRRDYMACTHYANRNSGGMFVPAETPFLASYLEGQGRDELRRVIQHEAFHQFAWFTISKNLPIWLNEGLAEMFAEGIWTGHDFILGQIPPRRIRQLLADAKEHRLVDFNKMLAITPQEWSENLAQNVQNGTTYYTQAWAMAYFLTESSIGNYHNQFVAFVKLLHNGSDADSAFKESFGGNVQAFQNAFSQWGGTLRPTPEATMLERMDILGDMLEWTSQREVPATMAAFRGEMVGSDVQLTYTVGKVQYRSEPPQVYFSDLNGKLYSAHQLYFQPSHESQLPDIVLQPGPAIQLRTHFYHADDRMMHEVLIVTMQ